MLWQGNTYEAYHGRDGGPWGVLGSVVAYYANEVDDALDAALNTAQEAITSTLAGVAAAKGAVLVTIGGAAIVAPTWPVSVPTLATAAIAGAAGGGAVYFMEDGGSETLREWMINELMSPLANLTHNLLEGEQGVSCRLRKKVKEDLDDDSKLNRRDPLIIDLNGDGIVTTGLSDGVFFDHDSDGLAEQSAWVNANDGLLVMDRNGNGLIDSGRELFGVDTLLADGQLATEGFEALAELDDNGDGVIDNSDSAYALLRVWRDTIGDGRTLDGELFSLGDLGITAIALDAAEDFTLDAAGNMRAYVGTYEKADGSSGEIACYGLQTNEFFTSDWEALEVPDDMQELANLEGSGVLLELHQAMIRDDELRGLVEEFVAEGDAGLYDGMLEEILFRWSGAGSTDQANRGENIDARRLEVLEKYLGVPFENTRGDVPEYPTAVGLNESYRGVYEKVYSEMMSLAHLSDLCGEIVYRHDFSTGRLDGDLTAVSERLQEELAANPTLGGQRLAQFARIIRPYTFGDTFDYLGFREGFIQQDPSLGWVIDTGGLLLISRLS